MRTLLWGTAGLTVAVAFTSRRQPPSTWSASGEDLQMVRAIAAEAGLALDWQNFLALVALGESGANPDAINDDPDEAAAAARSYDRNEDRLDECGYPRSSYVFGSGGWFGFLPAVGVLQLGKKHRCINPADVFNPRIATAMAVGFANGLMRREGFKALPTWANLRTMWGAPSKGGDAGYLASKRPKHNEHAKAVGLSPAWLDQPARATGLTAAQALENLGES